MVEVETAITLKSVQKVVGQIVPSTSLLKLPPPLTILSLWISSFLLHPN
jgi:hypothetical protein